MRQPPEPLTVPLTLNEGESVDFMRDPLADRTVCLAAYCLFETVAQVQDYATKRLWSYNHEHPNIPVSAQHMLPSTH
ncbi:hypothetical protein D0839_01550 [Bordetella avium]|nr:hypothetical protein C0J09_05970 [Bordetella avium]AZY52118.1 hypothetical protein C0J07_06040 [Bordetella avium]RIQ14045.1 hypothetical protein D0432_07190 [Bordetella avium]RIQ17918.1 hypothetical protein D0850_07120 [Bordetella avium]RIQ36394.1 hypothetical protein D0849_01600 [Bordetella avium]